MVLYQRTAAGIKMSSKVGPFFVVVTFAVTLAAGWSNIEQVVAQWQHPVASEVALDMPHWGMPSVLLPRTAMAIKMANGGGAFVCYCCSFA
jgi:hypothetical protein